MTLQHNSLKPRQKRRPIPISLTPLIDVVFMLLIFFMLASGFDKIRSIEMALPASEGVSSSARQPAIILVQGEEKYQIRPKAHGWNRSYGLDELQPFLIRQGVSSVLIETGPRAVAQDLTRLLDRLKAMDLQRVSLLPFDEKANE